MLQKSQVIYKSNTHSPGRTEGQEQAAKTQERAIAIIDPEEERLNQAIQKEKRTLISVRTFFPFDFFPDRVAIDLDKISIKASDFFGTDTIKTYEILDYDDLEIENGPIFSTVKLIKSGPENKEAVIRHLKKRDADNVSRILSGILRAHKEQIDLTKITSGTLIEKIEELGRIYV